MFATILTIITLFCAGYFFFLNYSKRKQQGNKLLMVFVLVAASQQILIGGLKLWSRDELYLGLFLPFGLLYGPAVLFLVNSSKGKATTLKSLLHFLPSLLGTILFGLIGLKQWMLYRYHIESMLFIHLFSFVHFCIYITLIGLKNQLETGADIFMLMKRSGPKAYLLVLMFATLIVEMFIMVSHDKNVLIHEVFVLSFFLTFLSVLSLFYRPSRHRAVQTKRKKRAIHRSVSVTVVADRTDRLPVRSSSDKRERLYRQRLQQFIDTKAYLDTELNKEKFCQQLGIPVNNISPFLKKEFGKGYNAFINHLRVKYAAAQLKNTALRTTVDDLSFVCGFNSRASFYRSFQSEFGCTPSQFCKTIA
ncbi:AraC family transcriptional regulator [Sphingobacterium thalpophilum]|uniref:AraC family transcriptional regulator n=1 Tax=Sphingobacterium thalpophilum TaxID=259 RepID=A0ABV4HCD4_9SPHI